MSATICRTAASTRCSPCVGASRRSMAQVPRSSTIVSAKGEVEASGFVQNDNSGKSNIFPTQQKAFFSSPTTDAAAREGLGGVQGAAVLLGALALVGAGTAVVLSTGGSGETLSSVQSTDVPSLAAVAKAVANSL